MDSQRRRANGLELFFVLACAVSWAIWWPFMLGQIGLAPKTSPYLHLLGSLGPAIAAFAAAAVSGAVRRLLSDLTNVKASPAAWVAALVGPAALLLVGLVAQFVFDGTKPQFGRVLTSGSFPDLGPLALVGAQVVFFGFGEEIGWRGYALPAMAERLGLLRASLLVSVPWAGWHLPLLFATPTYQTMGLALLAGWLVSVVTGSLLLAWIWRRGKRAIAPVAVFHGLLDIAMVNPAVSRTGLAVMGAAVTFAGLAAIVHLRSANAEA